MDAIKRLTTTLALLLLLPLAAAAQTSPTASEALPFTLKQIRPGVFAGIGGPKLRSNAGFVVGDDDVLVIDRSTSLALELPCLAHPRPLRELASALTINNHMVIVLECTPNRPPP